jgi:Zn-dependent peptidase ImmA (M78 family)
MRWAEDRTGRSRKRPFFTYWDLERLVDSKLSTKRRSQYPMSTDELTNCLEWSVSLLELYHDFPSPSIDGETLWDKKTGIPTVLISRRLAENPRYENRFLSTVTHELGHVVLHTRLYKRL